MIIAGAIVWCAVGELAYQRIVKTFDKEGGGNYLYITPLERMISGAPLLLVWIVMRLCAGKKP